MSTPYERWYGDRPKDPSTLKRQHVKFDKWDEADLHRLLDELPAFLAENKLLCERVSTGNAMWADVFRLFHKSYPQREDGKDVNAKYKVNGKAIDELVKLKSFDQLVTSHTQGDEIGSALATMTMRPDIEICFDKLQKQQELAEQLANKLKELFDALQQGEAISGMLSSDLSDEERAALEDQMLDVQALIEQLEGEAGELSQRLEEALKEAEGILQRQLGKGLDKALKGAEEAEAMVRTFGTEAGQMTKVDPLVRMELAKRMNNDHLRRVVEMFGRLERMMLTEQRRRTDNAVDEVYDIVLGDDLARVLPAELSALRHPVRKLDFAKRFLDRSLLQYETRGYERIARGDIIYIHDGSSSMTGDPHAMASALGVTLLNLGRKQKRGIHTIQFGWASEIDHREWTKPEHFSFERILDYAGFFFNGGTHFMAPLSLGLQLMQQHHEQTGAVKADIVFATDGAAEVDDKWLEAFKREQERLGFKVWGIYISSYGGTSTATLDKICDGNVATITDVVNGTDPLRPIFQGIGSR